MFENTILRRIVGPIYDRNEDRWRRRHNDELREITRQEEITDVIRRSKLRWAGHIARMEDNRIPKKVMLGTPLGRMPVGTPRMRWMVGLRSELDRRGIEYNRWMEIAQDRAVWRNALLAGQNQEVVQVPAE